METRLKQKRQKDAFLSGESLDKYNEESIMISGYNIGRPDGETDEDVIERKVVSKWKHAIGQVLTYSIWRGKSPVLELIEDKEYEETYRDIIRKTCKKLNISVIFIAYEEAKKASDEIKKDWRYKLSREQLGKYIKPALEGICTDKEYRAIPKSDLCTLLDPMPIDELSTKDLKSIATKLDIQGRSSMNKDKLVKSLKNHPEISSPKKIEIKPKNISNLESYTRANLIDMAREMGLTGYSKLKKDDLISLISSKK